MLAVADDLTDSEDAGLDAGLLCGVDTEVFSHELGLGIAHLLCVCELLGERFGDVIFFGVDHGTDGGAEVESCWGWSLGLETEVD